MKPLKINQEYRALVPRPIPEEYAALEQDMISKGEATEPIVINRDGVILDGFTRFQIAQRHGLYYETIQRDFESPEDEKRFVIETNLFRRHLTPYQKTVLAKPLEDVIAEAAGLRMKAGTLASDEARGKTSEVVAQAIGLKVATYERAKKIRDCGDVNIKEKVASGELSISKAYNQLIPVTPDDPLGIEQSSLNAVRKKLGQLKNLVRYTSLVSLKMRPLVVAEIMDAVDALNGIIEAFDSDSKEKGRRLHERRQS